METEVNYEDRLNLTTNKLAVITEELTDTQRALAWVLWQSAGQEVLISEKTMVEMPFDMAFNVEHDPRAGVMRIWLTRSTLLTPTAPRPARPD